MGRANPPSSPSWHRFTGGGRGQTAFNQTVQLFIQGLVLFLLLSPHGLLPGLQFVKAVFHVTTQVVVLLVVVFPQIVNPFGQFVNPPAQLVHKLVEQQPHHRHDDGWRQPIG